MKRRSVMPNLQVREVPAAVYGALAEASRQEHRSLAQQTLVTLERGLGLAEDPRERRRRLVRSIRESPAADAVEALPSPVELVREDRNR
jgi:hypothetical protein